LALKKWREEFYVVKRLRKLHCLSASEFGAFQRHAVKFSQFLHSLDFLVLFCQEKRTSTSGERVLKGRSNGQTAYVNGENKGGSGNMGNFTVYVNPYLVLKSGGYTKHYYIEGQRIVSKLGGGFDNNGKGPLKAGEGKVDYNGKQQKIRDGIVKNLKFLGLDGSILTAGKSGKIPPGQLNTKTQGGGKTDTETFQYFYHPDHLGSTSYITDASGEVYQHLEYFAFGETFVEEHSNTDRTPYLYNGKELDEETGLYYYGARYYDARVSIWLAVDPKAEEFIGWSPYNYAMNSPIVYIDPDGRAAIKWPPGWWVEHGTRIVGGLKVIGGAAEMVAGGAAILTPEPTMVTKVVGAAAVVHGADNVSAGLTQMMTGQDQSTLTSQGMQAAGVSKETADLVDGGISIALTGGAGALTKTAQSPSSANATANVAKNGSTVSNRLGQQMHKAYKADEVLDGVRMKEFSLPSGKRIDFIDLEKKIIYELKPNNPRAIKLGNTQLDMYKKEVESIYGSGFKVVLDTY
jgi:RHS repeat-associated protein